MVAVLLLPARTAVALPRQLAAAEPALPTLQHLLRSTHLPVLLGFCFFAARFLASLMLDQEGDPACYRSKSGDSAYLAPNP